MTVRSKPVELSLIVTGTLATTAPDGSVTIPRIVPDVFCATTGTDNRPTTTRAKHSQLPKRFICSPTRNNFVLQCVLLRPRQEACIAHAFHQKRDRLGRFQLCFLKIPIL